MDELKKFNNNQSDECPKCGGKLIDSVPCDICGKKAYYKIREEFICKKCAEKYKILYPVYR